MSGFRKEPERWPGAEAEQDDERERETFGSRRRPYGRRRDYGDFGYLDEERGYAKRDYGLDYSGDIRSARRVEFDPYDLISSPRLYGGSARQEQGEVFAYIDDRVKSSCHRFHQETGVEVSSHAQRLTVDILVAIILDPHPLWRASEEFRRDRVEVILNNLPLLLNEVRGRRITREHITSFDLLHFLSFRLQDLCIFK